MANTPPTLHQHEIDVVICTYNRADRLAGLLGALQGQTMPHTRFGILVVDDGSSDGTGEVCRNRTTTLPNLRYVRSPTNLGLSNIRNMGLKHTAASRVLFIDDDCTPHPDWVETMAAALDSHPIVAGGIESPEDNFWQLCHNIIEFHPFLISKKERRVPFLAGANMGFRREILESLRGFENNRNMAEDMELALRAGNLGWPIFFTPTAVVRHAPPRYTFREILIYSAAHARYTILLRRKYSTYLQIPGFVLSIPFLIVFSPGIAALKTCEIFFTDPVLLKRHLAALPVIFLTKLAWCFGACRGLASCKEP